VAQGVNDGLASCRSVMSGMPESTVAQASASSPEQRSDAYFDQCMIREQPTPQNETALLVA
jgi:hypothetical protein